MRAKTLGESKYGMHMDSIDPHVLMRAAVFAVSHGHHPKLLTLKFPINA